MGVSALCPGQPKLEASQVCSLGSLPPPGSTLPSFPVVLGDLSQTHSPGNGNTVMGQNGPTSLPLHPAPSPAWDPEPLQRESLGVRGH